MKRPDHQAKVKRWLLKGRKLSSDMAWKMWRCTRLASCINRLRDDGYNIETEMKRSKANTFYAVYKHVI